MVQETKLLNKKESGILNGITCHFVIDLHTGLLEEDIIGTNGVNYTELVNLHAPCSYDEWIRACFSSPNGIEFAPGSRYTLIPTKDNLLTAFFNGKRRIEVEVHHLGSTMYSRLVFLQHHDNDSGHVLADVRGEHISDLYDDSIFSNGTEEAAPGENAGREGILRDDGIITTISKLFYAVFLIDLESDVFKEVYSDSIVHHVTGYTGSAQQKLDELCETFASEEYRQALKKFFALPTLVDRLSESETVAYSYTINNGSWHQARFIAKNRDENGIVRSVLFVTRIINKEKTIEQEQQRMLMEAYNAAEAASRAKTLFLNSMSHDIRTPMNGIIGMAAIAGAHLDDRNRVKDCLRKISTASTHLLSLINEVLDVSRIESGKMELNAEAYCIAEHFDGLIAMVTPQIKSRNHTLNVAVRNLEHENVIGDLVRIKQVFLNIISNAVKYTPDGGTINISLQELASDNPEYGVYEFVCEDNGIGMTPDFQRTIFEPFSRAADVSEKGIQGTGLGMTIARNLLCMMGGDIRVESEYGKGSRFTVKILLKIHETGMPRPKALEGIPILLAGNDAEECNDKIRILRSFGMAVDYASSGTEVLERIKAKHDEGTGYRICMLIESLPDMAIKSMAHSIRNLEGGEQVALLYASDDWEAFERAACTAGISDFITRPIFASRLQNKLLSMLGEGQNGTKEPVTELGDFYSKDYSGKRILLAEDNELNQEIAVEILKSTKVAVDVAENGFVALDLFEKSPVGYYDLILMDIQMPKMSGHQASRAIRLLDRTDAVTVPIVALSANAFMEDMESSLRSGMNDHLAKPMELGRLNVLLGKYLGGK